MNWEQVSDKKKRRITGDIGKIARTVSSNKVRVGFKTRFMFEMMRMMQLKGWGSSSEEKEYWQEKGWLGNKRPWNS